MSSIQRDLVYYLEPMITRLIESLPVEDRQRFFDSIALHDCNFNRRMCVRVYNILSGNLEFRIHGVRTISISQDMFYVLELPSISNPEDSSYRIFSVSDYKLDISLDDV